MAGISIPRRRLTSGTNLRTEPTHCSLRILSQVNYIHAYTNEVNITSNTSIIYIIIHARIPTCNPTDMNNHMQYNPHEQPHEIYSPHERPHAITLDYIRMTNKSNYNQYWQPNTYPRIRLSTT